MKWGCLWVRSNQGYNLKTLHGEIQTRGPVDYFVQMREGKVYLFNHLGMVTLLLRDGRRMQIPKGFSLWISEIGSSKKNEIGVLTPISISEHLPELYNLWPGDVHSFKNEVRKLTENWEGQTEMASRYYKSLVSRKLASIEDKKSQERNRKRRELEQRKYYQKLLFDRAFTR